MVSERGEASSPVAVPASPVTATGKKLALTRPSSQPVNPVMYPVVLILRLIFSVR